MTKPVFHRKPNSLIFFTALIFMSFITVFFDITNSITAQEDPSDDKSCYDQSGHKEIFITVDIDVKLEVLDWGGTGEYLVLLTGLGDNAHVYDHFAYQFTDLYHVIGITRRGYGKSDKPAAGYSEDRRAQDILNVLDHLGIQSAVFAGHSIAGGELSQLGQLHQDRVKKLIYMDAAPDFGQHKFLAQPPSPDYRDEDLVSVERFIAATVRYFGYREPNSAVCNTFILGKNGEVIDALSPPDISKQIIETSEDKDFTKINVPVLAIFDTFTDDYRLPFFFYLDEEKQSEYLAAWFPLVKWQQDLIKRFSAEVENIKVISLYGAYHYIYLNRESDVAREMRKFLMME